MNSGFLLEIEETNADEHSQVYCGCIGTKPALCTCPNCGGNMFPVFSIHRSAFGMPDLEIYDEDGFVTLDVCPSCSHCLRNYSVSGLGPQRVVAGGYIDGKGPANFIDVPFGNRAVAVVPIADNMWESTEFSENYFDRKLLSGVRHQIGGKKMKEEKVALLKCLCCGGDLSFLGTVDNDDLNIPLYEQGEPPIANYWGYAKPQCHGMPGL